MGGRMEPYKVCMKCYERYPYEDGHECHDVSESSLNALLCCPFCGEIPQKYDGNLSYRVTHKPGCFLGTQGGAYTTEYIEGDKKISNWNKRVK